ncbi:MAG: DUF542 domain-containing protein [Elusimicrobia bacterium]|nr:DUF542 domain-containing protein [Elusimicrobiota bacterium]MDE2426011.1 DUF542 domain-containing protein [Elusimicrobiota bacterium]
MNITSDMTIRDVIERFPATRKVFFRHRLEACCGGAHSIAVAAVARGIDPDHLISEIRRAVEAA